MRSFQDILHSIIINIGLFVLVTFVCAFPFSNISPIDIQTYSVIQYDLNKIETNH